VKEEHLVLSKEWHRHGKYSGYECVISEMKIREVEGIKIPYFAANYFKKKTNLVNYSSIALSKELTVLLKIPFYQKIHILYADMDYYYLHLLKRNFVWKGKSNEIIATFHHPPEELEKRLGYERTKILGALDKIIVMGRNQIPFLKNYTDATIKFIPHGINTKFFKPGLLLTNSNQILIIGVSHRDHIFTRRIIQEVGVAAPDIKFKVVVPKRFDDHYQNLQNVLLETGKISDHDLLKLYQSSRGVLLMLNYCTASNTLLESLATGCPLIINEIGAVRDYIPETSRIPVFSKGDLNSIVDYLISLCRDEEKFRSMLNRQVALARQYDWEIISHATKEFIEL